MPTINARWLDSAKITLLDWEQFAYKGFGLKSIADYLLISFDHHDALQDAIAAGLVVVKACSIKGMTIEDWFIRIEKTINQSASSSSYSLSFGKEGNPEGPLFVFQFGRAEPDQILNPQNQTNSKISGPKLHMFRESGFRI